MSEETFAYQAENGNECEVVDTFAEMFTILEISPENPTFLAMKTRKLGLFLLI